MFEVDFTIARRFVVNVGQQAAFELLKDVPRSAGLFPGLAALDTLGENCYRWRMERIGLSMLSLETVYACKYKSDESRSVVQWTPVKAEGNAQVHGSWRLKVIGAAQTEVKLHSAVRVEVPLPALAKGLLAPLVAREYNKLIERYVENIVKTFDTGDAKPETGKGSPKAKLKTRMTAKAKAKVKPKPKAKAVKKARKPE